MEAIFWQKRYDEGSTGWDLGEVSPPIKAYIDQLTDKNIRILIPGAGRAYEAEYLHRNGFNNVYVADIASQAFSDFKKRYPDFPENQCIIGDFFSIDQQFDVIIEQTFFCALPPAKREAYATKTASLLNRGGYLVGLLFQFPLTEQGPPFGSSKDEYESYFSRMFAIHIMEDCYNSHPSRKNKELFIKLIKK